MLAGFVRDNDRDRYLATLFAPAAERDGLFALYAFNIEIARVRELVSDPLPGEMRFQWWRDLLAGEARGDSTGHPVAAALMATVRRYNLPTQALLDLIEARTFDLYDESLPDRTELEGYCGATASALIRLASIVLAGGSDPGGAEAAGHAGVAYAVTGLLRAIPWHVRRGQLFLPADMMRRHGLTREAALSGTTSPALLAVLAEMRNLARQHLAETRTRIASVPRGVAPAFLPVSLVDLYLAAMEEPGYDPFHSVIDLPAWRKIWRYWRQSRRAA
jgi:phytoene synthase